MVPDRVGIDTSYGPCWVQPGDAVFVVLPHGRGLDSRTHFGHAGIPRRRGWATSVDEHDETLIASWNETIGPADEVCRGNHDTNLVLACPGPRCPVESARIRVQDSFAAEVGLYLAR